MKTKVFCKLIVSLWICVARYAQSTHLHLFPEILQRSCKLIYKIFVISQEKREDELDLLPKTDKLQRFLQIAIII